MYCVKIATCTGSFISPKLLCLELEAPIIDAASGLVLRSPVPAYLRKHETLLEACGALLSPHALPLATTKGEAHTANAFTQYAISLFNQEWVSILLHRHILGVHCMLFVCLLSLIIILLIWIKTTKLTSFTWTPQTAMCTYPSISRWQASISPYDTHVSFLHQTSSLRHKLLRLSL